MKRKRAEGVDESDREGKNEVNAIAGVDDKGDTVDKKIKTDPGLRQAAIIKSGEKLGDGSLDLTQDS